MPKYIFRDGKIHILDDVYLPVKSDGKQSAKKVLVLTKPQAKQPILKMEDCHDEHKKSA